MTLAPRVVFCLLVPTLVACRHAKSDDRERGATVTSSAAEAAASPKPPPLPGTLPEDPDAGAKSSAEWHEHLEHEERERRLGYDRRKLPEHRALVKILQNARKTYDGAATQRAVETAAQAFRSTLPDLDERLDAIDHWGVSSKVLPNYRKLAATLSGDYPAARIAALAGDKSALERVEKNIDAEFATIDAWLREAAESEDD